MKRYIAFLRGINISGKNKVPMAELKQDFERLDYVEVKTYGAAAAIVLTAPSPSPDRTYSAAHRCPWAGSPCPPRRRIEGFVIEDSAGYMTKLKLAYYNFWKFMRSVSHEAIRFSYRIIIKS